VRVSSRRRRSSSSHRPRGSRSTPRSGALSSFSWLVFTSVNGVTMVDRRLDGARYRPGRRWRTAAWRPSGRHGRRAPRARVRWIVVPASTARRSRRAPARAARAGRSRAAAARRPDARRAGDLAAGARCGGGRGPRVRHAARGGQRDAAGGGLSEGAVDAVTFTLVVDGAELCRDVQRGRAAGLARPRRRRRSIGPITAATAAEYGLATTSCRRSTRSRPRAGDCRVVRPDSERPIRGAGGAMMAHGMFRPRRLREKPLLPQTRPRDGVVGRRLSSTPCSSCTARRARADRADARQHRFSGG